MTQLAVAHFGAQMPMRFYFGQEKLPKNQMMLATYICTIIATLV